jgi:hypothetical protein
VSFEAAQRRSRCFAVGDLTVVVASCGASGPAELDDGDGVDGGVQLPVAVAVEPVALVFGAGDFDWGGAVVGGIGGRGGKPGYVTGSAQDAGRQHRANAVDLAQSRAVLVEQPGGFGLIVGQLLVEAADIGDQLFAQLQPNPLGVLRGRNPRTAAAALAAVRSVGTPPASSSRSSRCS